MTLVCNDTLKYLHFQHLADSDTKHQTGMDGFARNEELPSITQR